MQPIDGTAKFAMAGDTPSQPEQPSPSHQENQLYFVADGLIGLVRNAHTKGHTEIRETTARTRKLTKK